MGIERKTGTKINIDQMTRISDETIFDNHDVLYEGLMMYDFIFHTPNGCTVSLNTNLIEKRLSLSIKKSHHYLLSMTFDFCEKIEVVNEEKKQIEITGGIEGKKIHAKCFLTLNGNEHEFLIRFL